MFTTTIRATATSYSSLLSSHKRSAGRQRRRFIPSPATPHGALLESRSLAGLLLSGRQGSLSSEINQSQQSQPITISGMVDGLQALQQPVLSIQSQSSAPNSNGALSTPSVGTIQPADAGDIVWPIYVVDTSLSDPSLMFEDYLRNSSTTYSYMTTGSEGFGVQAHLSSNAPAVGDGLAQDTFLDRDSMYGGTPTDPGTLQIEDNENLTLDCGSGCGKYYDITDQMSNPNGLSSYTQYFDFITYDGTTKEIGGPWSGGSLVEQGTFIISASPATNAEDNWNFTFSGDGVSVDASMYGATINYSTPSGPQTATASGAGYSLDVSFVYSPTLQYNKVQFYSYHELGASATPPAGWTTSDSLSWEYKVSVSSA